MKLAIPDIDLCIGCIMNSIGPVAGDDMRCNKHLITWWYIKAFVGYLTILGEGLMPEKQGDFSAIIADKEYRGPIELFKVPHPFKWYQNSPLSAFDKEANRQISSDRATVENYVGINFPLPSLFPHKRKWNETVCDTSFRLERILPITMSASVYFMLVAWNTFRVFATNFVSFEGKYAKNVCVGRNCQLLDDVNICSRLYRSLFFW